MLGIFIAEVFWQTRFQLAAPQATLLRLLSMDTKLVSVLFGQGLCALSYGLALVRDVFGLKLAYLLTIGRAVERLLRVISNKCCCSV